MNFMEVHPAMNRIPQAYRLKHFDHQTFRSVEDKLVFAEDDSTIPPPIFLDVSSQEVLPEQHVSSKEISPEQHKNRYGWEPASFDAIESERRLPRQEEEATVYGFLSPS